MLENEEADKIVYVNN